ncbi:phage integrase N-terminal domain-containing protein [Hydrogenophaga sp. BPS33]|uniref:phage integrase N-terminal domain-containing protein n=1 Tax=Hydrogenophaga sp. BPS33 TaxID=2651974 RepID=UPI001358FCE0|nr:phage integrase N-terminal domain-containing protein [Hydrogenophaga sp. BPS33]
MSDDDFELPDPREVNRKISEELRSGKLKERVIRRNTGALAKTVQQAQQRHKNDIVKQVVYVMTNEDLPVSTGRKRRMSEGSQSGVKEGLLRAARELKAERMAVRNLDELGRKHVLALIKRWMAEGQSYQNIQNKVSTLRTFTTMMGKPSMIPRNADYFDWLERAGVDLLERRKSKVALEPKTWTAKNVDPMGVIGKMRAEHPVVALCLEAMLAFGLRTREATHLEPIGGDLGDTLHIREGGRGGAKGGKSRTVPLSEDVALRIWQRDVLERAKVLARHHRQLKLAVPGKDYPKMLRHFYYVCEKYGVTRDGLGVLPHGLRHMYAGRRHLELTGLPPPVEGTVPMAVYRANADLVREGAQRLSLEMGHVRPTITGAYNGSVYTQSREEIVRAKAWLERIERCAGLKAMLDAFAVRTVYLGGKAAQGVRLLSGDSVRLLVEREGVSAEARDLELLQRAIAALLRPGDGLAVEVQDVSKCEDARDSYLELSVRG